MRALGIVACLQQGKLAQARQVLGELKQWPSPWHGFWHQQQALCALADGADGSKRALQHFGRRFELGGAAVAIDRCLLALAEAAWQQEQRFGSPGIAAVVA